MVDHLELDRQEIILQEYIKRNTFIDPERSVELPEHTLALLELRDRLEESYLDLYAAIEPSDGEVDFGSLEIAVEKHRTVIDELIRKATT